MRKRQRRGRSSPPFPLPLDLVLEIAARSDPVTLVRCAAASKDLRRRIAYDPAFRARLRLRLRHADRFVPSLLRGHLVEAHGEDNDKHLVDYSTGRLTAAGCFPSGEPSRLHEPVAARDGLVLVRTTGGEPDVGELMRMCSPVTGRCQTIPSGATFHGQYVLLVGDGEGGGGVGRTFQVLKVSPVLSRRSRHRCLQIQTFSSSHGVWSPRARIRTPHDVHGGWPRRTPLVTNGAVHWLCRSDTSYYIFKLDVGAAQVTATKLPASFHAAYGRAVAGRKNILLVTKSPTGKNSNNLCVLVADNEKISMWSQSSSSGGSPARWGDRPEAVIMIDEVMRLTPQQTGKKVRLEWFAERSGVMLITVPGSRCFWLDVRSREIFRWPSGPWTVESAINCPYEMDLSSWVPTFCTPVRTVASWVPTLRSMLFFTCRYLRSAPPKEDRS